MESSSAVRSFGSESLISPVLLSTACTFDNDDLAIGVELLAIHDGKWIRKLV